MNTKHLSTGSKKPTFPEDGKFQLYSMRFCPYAQRIHLVLDAKNIPYHTVNIDLTDKPEWLKSVSEFGKVPALGLVNEKGVPTIFESLIIADYLDEQFPERKLYPINLLAKARERIWIERFGTIAVLLYKAFVATDGIPSDILTEIGESFDLYEKELKTRGTNFFGGKTPGILDYMIWPWIERIEMLQYLTSEKPIFDVARFPKLVEWIKKMKEDPAVKVSYIPGEVHAEFVKSRKSGKANYDILVK